MLEELEGNNFANINQVTGYSDTHLHIFIHTQTLNLWHNKALAQGLTHILGKFVKDFQS